MQIRLPNTSSLNGECAALDIPYELHMKLRVASYRREYFVRDLLRIFVARYPKPTVENLEKFLEERTA